MVIELMAGEALIPRGDRKKMALAPSLSVAVTVQVRVSPGSLRSAEFIKLALVLRMTPFWLLQL